MSTHRPTTDQVRLACGAFYGAESFDRWLSATLATVRPNPDDARQVEALSDVEIRYGVAREGLVNSVMRMRLGPTNARAVLTALAEAVGQE